VSIALDADETIGYGGVVTARKLIRILERQGCIVLRQRGYHVRIRCGRCYSTDSVHAGEDLGPGLLAKIKRDLDPCLGEGWLKGEA